MRVYRIIPFDNISRTNAPNPFATGSAQSGGKKQLRTEVQLRKPTHPGETITIKGNRRMGESLL